MLSDVLSQAGQPRANRITVSEEANAFVVELPVALQPEWIKNARKVRLTYFIAKDAAAASKEKGERVVNMDEQWRKIEARKAWRAAGNDSKSDDATLREQWMALQPHEYLNLFTAAQNLKAWEPNNNIWAEVEKANYPKLLEAIIETFSKSTSASHFGTQHSTATMFNPTQGTGTNTLTPLGAKSDKPKSLWPAEWLKAIGFYQAAFCVSFQNSKKEVVGVSVAVLCPRHISLRNHHPIREHFALTFYAGSSLKLECLAALRYANSFLTFAQTDAEADDLRGRNVTDAVSGFSLTYFMLVGQAKNKNFKPKRITFIAMPRWIHVPTDGNVAPIHDVVEEHIKVLSGLARNKKGEDVEPKGEEYQLLNSYLAWSSSGDLRQFWTFCAGYGAHRIECASKDEPCRALTTRNLEVILMNQSIGEKPLAPIIGDEHF